MTQSSSGFSRVLIGIDFSPSSLRALELARERFAGATLRLAHVTDARVGVTPDVLGGVTPVVPDVGLIQELEHADAQRLHVLAQAGEETELLVGDPVTGILESARQWQADLIVVGTASKTALEHFLLGSSAEKLVARSPIPVLTVRGPHA